MLIPDWDSGGRPLQQLVVRLSKLQRSPREFGSLTGVSTFVKSQIGMQLRKRMRKGATTRGQTTTR
jgi:hypothetical protein